jgi:DNA polymerase
MKEELLGLTRQLRRRLEQDGAMAAPPRAEAAGSPPAARRGLEEVAAEIGACRRCPLGQTRLNAVPGAGSAAAQVMFIGEGPGYWEDHKGEPFVGPSGELLDKIMASIGLSRRTVYIANIVKCHPMKNPSDAEARGNDRPPMPEEAAACRPYLDEQIRLIGPRVIVTLGAVAARELLGEPSITRARGQWRSYAPEGGSPIRVLPTYHPAALLRDPDLKKDVWTDMKNLRTELSR